MKIKVKCSNESAFELEVNETDSILTLKQLIESHFVDSTPVSSQRLIFAGKVLKDEETVDFYKIKEGNTIHVVRGKKEAPAPTTTNTTPVPQTAPAPTPTPNPAFNLFGNPGQAPSTIPAFGGNPMMGGMPPGMNPDMLLNNPMTMQFMSQMLSNPEMMDSLIASNPQLQQMLTPEMRQALRTPEFQNMARNPEFLRTALSMQAGMGGMGGGFNPMNNMFGMPANNNFANPTGLPVNNFSNPMVNSQPPEQLYATQLQQLQDMGFFNAQENVRALQMAGGNVEAAVEYLFSRPPGM